MRDPEAVAREDRRADRFDPPAESLTTPYVQVWIAAGSS